MKRARRVAVSSDVRQNAEYVSVNNVLKIVTALGPSPAYILAIPPAKMPVAPTSLSPSAAVALYLYAKLIAHTVTTASTHSRSIPP